jgi:hypothetical protein
VCGTLIASSVAVVRAVRDLDVDVVQNIFESVLRSTANVEAITHDVRASVGVAVGVLNRSASSLDSLNHLLQHPTLSISLPEKR